MARFEEALVLLKKAEKVYSNDWNGTIVKEARKKLEEALAEEAAERAIMAIGIIDDAKGG